ncbi:MAG: MarR family transcriptional regulator [Rhodomicrobium sp.]|nr:MarR family transcriptional regulator [Rhodomicrobium sp.]
MTNISSNWLRLIQLVTSVEADLSKKLQLKHGIGLTQYRALFYLAAAKNSELRMQDLAAQLQLDQSSVTRVVERLERLGLTIRDVCPNDKRGVYTVLTEAGRQRLDDARPEYERQIALVLNDGKTRDVLSSVCV